MTRAQFVRRLPGYIGTVLATGATCLWTFWGMAEVYYEGWGLPFPTPLRYLIVGGLFMTFTLIALTWPLVGGGLLILIGLGFSLWWGSLAVSRGHLSLQWVMGNLFPLAGILIIVGILFLLEGRDRRRRRAEGWTPPKRWLRRNIRYVVAVGLPLVTAIITSVFFLPPILSRVDDGDRSARRIEGNGVALIWAPQGPGWNWKQEWGGYPSWNNIALYGVPPRGLKGGAEYIDWRATAQDMRTNALCRYLSEDGKTLLPEAQDIWRMPTAEEVVRSLVSGGSNAGCTWDGHPGEAECAGQANKDTPLWAPDEEAIYYWTADEYDEESAWYVSYNGGVFHQPKDWGNPRHGYRCVREP